MHSRLGNASPGAQVSDPWTARLVFHLLNRHGPWWVTLWLVLTIVGLTELPGAITAIVALTAGGAAMAKRIGGSRPKDTEPPTTGTQPRLDDDPPA